MENSVPPELQVFIQSQLAELKTQVQAKDQALLDLQKQLEDMKVKASSSSRKAKAVHPSAKASPQSKTPASKSSKHASTTPTKPQSKSKSTPNRSRSTPVKEKSSSKRKAKPPTPKRHPCQLIETDLPDGFKPVKDAFYLVIRVLWGMVEQGVVPDPPERKTLKEFYARFSTSSDIQKAHDNAASLALIAQEEIETLKNKKLEQKAGRGTLHLKEIHIMFIHATLAKIGLRRWGPDLNEATDSLLNCACRISAISAFRQVATGAAFDNANMDMSYINNIPLLIQVYDHYVHFVMAARFKKEQKQTGKYKQDQARKTIQRGRERLRKARLRFADHNNLPKRYQRFLADVAAHSDDEFSPKHNFHIVKTLKYRSANATKFIRRLDQEMAKASAVAGKPNQFRSRRIPKEPIMSTFTRPPPNCPLDFLSPEYFNSLSTHLKYTMVKTDEVIFLPDASKSLLPEPHRHPAEKFKDRKFIQKYYKKISAPYIIESVQSDSESTSSSSEDGDDGKDDNTSDYGTSIDLEASSDGDDSDAFYAEGEFEDSGTGNSDTDSELDEDFDPDQHQGRSGSETSSSSSSSDNNDKGKGKGKGKKKGTAEEKAKSDMVLDDYL